MFSYFEPSGFQILSKIEMMRNKMGYLAAILKRYNILIFFPELWYFDSSYIYGTNFINMN